MTEYSRLNRFILNEPDAFDSEWPTSVHRMRTLFDNANHALDSHLQQRVSITSSGFAIPPPVTGIFDGLHRLVATMEVPWRILSYANDEFTASHQLARPVVEMSGRMFDANEYIDAVQFSLSMQPANDAPRRVGSTVIKRWDASVTSNTTVTNLIQSTDDITAANLINFAPGSRNVRSVRSIEQDSAGDTYDTRLSLTMVRFSVWVKPSWDGGEDWATPPCFLSSLCIREAAR